MTFYAEILQNNFCYCQHCYGFTLSLMSIYKTEKKHDATL